VATEAQYVISVDRACHEGKSTDLRKGVHVEGGRVCGVGPVLVVGDGKAAGCEGVRREFRCVEIGSSISVREIRMKERRAVVLKQSEGVR
jgi:hypothetical protein